MTRPTMEELREKIGPQGKQKQRYAGVPGTGPAGKTCRDCAFLTSTDPQGRGKHPKCGRTNFTAGDATTIRVRTPACKYFEEASE